MTAVSMRWLAATLIALILGGTARTHVRRQPAVRDQAQHVAAEMSAAPTVETCLDEWARR